MGTKAWIDGLNDFRIVACFFLLPALLKIAQHLSAGSRRATNS
jgi:hypothetical protein